MTYFNRTTHSDKGEQHVKQRAKAPSAIKAASTGTTRARRTMFGLACLCVLALAAFTGSGVPSVGAAESFPGQGFLPDNRAWEMVSPPEKNGAIVTASPPATQVSAGESPGLPAAAVFTSTNGFGDVHGLTAATQYMSQRTGAPGTNGWSTHNIYPELDAVSSTSFNANGPYRGELAPDLTQGIFSSLTPLTGPSKVDRIINLYTRRDLRTAGEGDYLLDSDCAACPSSIVPFGFGEDSYRQNLADTSADFRHVIFASNFNLTPDASGGNFKLYKSDDGVVRLIKAFEGCPGGEKSETAPCSAPGAGTRGSSGRQLTPNTLSDDGSRTIFSAPARRVQSGQGGEVNPAPGRTSRLFQLDDRGTPGTDDDALIEVSASEKASPEIAQPARYAIASSDGDRIFFTSKEQLTETPGGGLYMWDRKDTNETQQVEVDATGGTFTLTGRTQPSVGTGTVSAGSEEITEVQGSFAAGQTIEGEGIAPGTTIVAVGSFQNAENEKLIISQPASAGSSPATPLSASMQATTTPLLFAAPADQVQGALEALTTIGKGNVSVTGGPGGSGGGTPYSVTFRGSLAGVDVLQMLSDPSGLNGGGASAEVSTTTSVKNLSLIVADAALADGNSSAGVLAASDDGHRLYLLGGAGKQLVPGAPPVTGWEGIFYWQDATGPAEGTLSYVGDSADPQSLVSQSALNPLLLFRRGAWATPNGKHFYFERRDGGANQAYVYDAGTSTPTEPDLVCASCDPSGDPDAGEVILGPEEGITRTDSHLRGRLVSEDGRYAFFSTSAALDPIHDTNGQIDAYEYDTQSEEAHLLSSGQSKFPSYFQDASADGHDAYFVTTEQLSAWDTDDSADLYDARIGGGFPEPLPPPVSCEGDACQPPPTQLNDPTPASSSFSGPGDPKARKARHAKKHKRGHRHKRHQHASRRHATSTSRNG